MGGPHSLKTEPNRTTGEISDRPVTNVVMMGMGEPLANFENVVTALGIMLDDHAYGLSRRRVTVSTSGLVPAMDRLAERCPVALAVSLHAPNDALRDQIVPINKKYPLRELMAACQRYLAHAPRDFITFEYVMLAGVNDQPEHARQLIELTRDVPCKFNLIPFNPFPGFGLRETPDGIDAGVPPDPAGRGLCGDHAQDARRRHRCGLRTAGRKSGGQERTCPEKNAQGGSVKKSLGVLITTALLAGCVAQPMDGGGGGFGAGEADSQSRERAKAFTDLAAAYFSRTQYKVALDELRKAITADNRYGPAYNIYGMIYMDLAEDKLAEDNFRRAIDLDRNDSNARNNYGWFLCTRGRYDEGLAQFSAAIRNPLYTQPELAMTNAGLCAEKKGDMRWPKPIWQGRSSCNPTAPTRCSSWPACSSARDD